jgi:hypothetical protein
VDHKARIAAEDLLRDYRLQLSRARDNRMMSAERRAAMQAANRMLPKVNGLLLSLVPDTAPISGGPLLWQHEAGLSRVFRAEEVLGDWDEMTDDHHEVQFGITLGALDVVVLEAARQDWYNGHWRQAVANAAAKLNKFTQDRLGVHDISDSELMSEAFSENDPQSSRPRLRCPGNPESMTARSMQKGAKLFAMGAYMAIRNPAVHWTGNGNPASAGEQLAALSIIARWVRYWDVAQPPVPHQRRMAGEHGQGPAPVTRSFPPPPPGTEPARDLVDDIGDVVLLAADEGYQAQDQDDAADGDHGIQHGQLTALQRRPAPGLAVVLVLIRTAPMSPRQAQADVVGLSP